MGPFLTSQEKEKIDKCKKQVGIQDGSLSKRTNLEFKAMTKQSNSAFDWPAKKDPERSEICSTRGDGGGS